MPSRWYVIPLAGLALFAVGCSKAKTQFEVLDQNAIPQPLFSGAKTKQLTTSSGSETFTITGECDQKIKSITGSTVGVMNSFSSIDSISTTTVTVDCKASQTFSFTLKSLNALGFTSLVNGQIYEVRLKGVTSAGDSNPSSIFIRYESSPSAQLRVLAGGVHGDGASGAGDTARSVTLGPGSFRAQMRATSTESTTQTSSGAGTFRARLGSRPDP